MPASLQSGISPHHCRPSVGLAGRERASPRGRLPATTCQWARGFSPNTARCLLTRLGWAHGTRACCGGSPARGGGAGVNTRASVCGRTCWRSGRDPGFEARRLVPAMAPRWIWRAGADLALEWRPQGRPSQLTGGLEPPGPQVCLLHLSGYGRWEQSPPSPSWWCLPCPRLVAWHSRPFRAGSRVSLQLHLPLPPPPPPSTAPDPDPKLWRLCAPSSEQGTPVVPTALAAFHYPCFQTRMKGSLPCSQLTLPPTWPREGQQPCWRDSRVNHLTPNRAK